MAFRSAGTDPPVRSDCRSVAFTYNDPVIFMEYAVDVAQACRERDIKTVAVSAGYICAEPRLEFFRHMERYRGLLQEFVLWPAPTGA